jgi:hypothetical protein
VDSSHKHRERHVKHIAFALAAFLALAASSPTVHAQQWTVDEYVRHYVAQGGECLKIPEKAHCPPCVRAKGHAGSSGGIDWCNARWTGPLQTSTTPGVSPPSR